MTSYRRLYCAVGVTRIFIVCYVIAIVLSQFWFVGTRVGSITLSSNNMLLTIDYCHQSPSSFTSQWMLPYSNGMVTRASWRWAYPQFAHNLFDPASRSMHTRLMLPHWLILIGLLASNWLMCVRLRRNHEKTCSLYRADGFSRVNKHKTPYHSA